MNTCLLWDCDSQCSVALPHGAGVGLQCLIVVFPDHNYFLVLQFLIGRKEIALVISVY